MKFSPNSPEYKQSLRIQAEKKLQQTSIPDPENLTLFFLGAIRDLSKEEHLEQQLRQCQKMEAIGTLAGGIAYDFNYILFIILIGLEKLGLEFPTLKQNKWHEIIHSVSLRAKDLVKQILTFSQMELHTLKNIDLALSIKETLSSIQSILPTNIKIKVNQQAKQTCILGDETYIHQIMVNMCNNAGYAMKNKGGVLNIDLNNKFFDAQAALEFGVTQGEYVALTVTDTGIGMDIDQLARIYEPFFTTKPEGEGTGLGLSVIHGLVKELKGVIKAKSKLQEGSVFEIYFPLVSSSL